MSEHALMTHDVTVLASANLDVVLGVPSIPAPGETVLATGDRSEQPGGKGLNQTVAAARAGARTLLLGAVGSDAAADVLAGVAEDEGVDTRLLRRVGGGSGTAWIMVREDGENAIVVDSAANATVTGLTAEEEAAVAAGRVLVAQLEVPMTAVAQAAAAARAAGVRVVLNAAPAPAPGPEVEELLRLVDVLVVNEGEARRLAGADDPRQAADALLARVGAVVVTLGAEGALLVDGDGSRHVAGVPAQVRDTTGAGDTFTGYLAAALATGADLDEAVARAVVAGALAVEAAGAVPSIPTAAQVDERRVPG